MDVPASLVTLQHALATTPDALAWGPAAHPASAVVPEIPWPGPSGRGAAAVLALFSDADDPDLLVTVRSERLRDQPGQISFPGGSWEDGDPDWVATALRETQEEIGLDPAAVHVIGTSPVGHAPVRGHRVMGVVGWWDGTAPLAPDPGEVAAVLRWRVSALADPARRVTSVHPRGHAGPAWTMDDGFLWGFTGAIVDALLRLGGWARPWDAGRTCPVPARYMRERART
ncbi:MAG: CoA pyrophosphatase [Actinomycetia bacterium]|nr:CoA pyrophosphatase [Actinomycetes bacterium]